MFIYETHMTSFDQTIIHASLFLIGLFIYATVAAFIFRLGKNWDAPVWYVASGLTVYLFDNSIHLLLFGFASTLLFYGVMKYFKFFFVAETPMLVNLSNKIDRS